MIRFRYLVPVLILSSLLFIFLNHGDLNERISFEDKEPIEDQLKGILRDLFGDDEYSLPKFKLGLLCLKRVESEYISPENVDWWKMFTAALENVQRQIPELYFDIPESGSGFLTVIYEDTKTTIPMGEMVKMENVHEMVSKIFLLLEGRFKEKGIPLEEIEYSAINGMLKTLDPHSLLLPPKDSKELEIENRGEFGGIGIVISIRNDYLTVISPLEGTPAWKAGLRPGDRIIEINDESTVNMSLYDAVEKLRGLKGTAVRITIERPGLSNPFSVVLVRDTIIIKAVTSRYLKDGIGFIRLRDNFTEKTSSGMKEHLARMMREHPGMDSLILDLRGNTGGYFSQAVSVADAFLKEGVIVSTQARAGEAKDVKRAAPSGRLEDLKVAVLIDGGTASAAEIVAGALKNNDRAIVIGMRSFGKGTVQNLYRNFDGSNLKLTVSQYLTPGDKSIQSSGIIPDFLMLPVCLKKGRFIYDTYQEIVREEDLDSFHRDQEVDAEKPSFIIRYYDPELIMDSGKEDISESEKTYRDDYIPRMDEVLLAKYILANVKSGNRSAMLEEALPLLDEWEENQERVIAEAFLREGGIDWERGETHGKGRLNMDVHFTGSEGNVLEAGKDYTLKIRVENSGRTPLFRVRGRVVSNLDYLNKMEFPIGKILPSEVREWETDIHIPESEITKRAKLNFKLLDQSGKLIAEQDMTLTTKRLPAPRYSLSYQILDDADDTIRGNGDGLLQPGETVKLFFHLQNSGAGPSLDTKVKLLNHSGNNIFIKEGIFSCGEIEPEGRCSGEFLFTLNNPPESDREGLEIVVGDYKKRYLFTSILELSRYLKPGVRVSPGPWKMGKTGSETELLGAPSHSFPAIAKLGAGLPIAISGRWDSWLKIQVPDGLTGWVEERFVHHSSGEEGPFSEGVEYLYFLSQPVIDFSSPPPLWISRKEVSLKGTCFDEEGIRDVYVFTDKKKVFYKSGIDPSKKPPAYLPELSFSVDIPLMEEGNFYTLFCRNGKDIVNSEIFYTHRLGVEGD